MGCACLKDSWVLKFEANFAGVAIQDIPSDSSPSNPLPPHSLVSKLFEDILEKFSEMDEKFEFLQDLLLATHFKMDRVNESMEKVWAISKETGTDVANISLKLNQVIKKVIKVATEIQTSSEVVATSISNHFDNLKTATVNTLCYFLCPHQYVFF